jgi:hypothetical protein
MPLDGVGGPPDGTVDLVLGHAIADLLPLDRLARRVAALLHSGGLAHLALTYDGVTTFDPPFDGDVEARVLDAYHRRMDRAAESDPAYGGSTAGRRLAGALAGAGLEPLNDAPAIWTVSSGDGPGGRAVLDRLIRYVADGAGDVGTVQEDDVACWQRSRSEALRRRELVARVTHRDVLARKPGGVVVGERL